MTRLLACLCVAGLGLVLGPVAAGLSPRLGQSAGLTEAHPEGCGDSSEAAEPTLAEARQRWLRGNYEEARAAYRTLAAQERFRAAAAVGLSRVDEAQGRYDDAWNVLADTLSAVPNDADLLARRAELAYTLGRIDLAEKAVAAALAARDDHLLARFVRAQLKRDRGDL